MNNNWLMFLVIGLLSVTFSSRAIAGTEHSFCSVFVGDVCFALSRGDKLEMIKPADFTQYRIDFAVDATATIYYGRHPSKLAGDEIVQGTWENNYGRVILYKSAVGRYRVIYNKSNSNSVVDIELQVLDEGAVLPTQRFLDTFRACNRIGNSVSCGEALLFQNLILE